MKIITIYSESNKELFLKFCEGMTNLDNKYELCSRLTPQVCKTGHYSADDAIKFWYLKVLYILEYLYQEIEPFVYADADVYFFRDFKDDLEKQMKGKDIAIQYEKHILKIFPMVCAGFMYIRPNKRMRNMFGWVLKNMDRFGNDQTALNRYIYTYPVKFAMLPKTYYSINYDNGDKVWDGEPVDITVKNPFIAHMHWTIGNLNKLKLLEMVKEQVCAN